MGYMICILKSKRSDGFNLMNKWLLISDGRMMSDGSTRNSRRIDAFISEIQGRKAGSVSKITQNWISQNTIVFLFSQNTGWEWLGDFFHRQKMTGNIINHNCSHDWDISWDISPDISCDISWDISKP